MKNVITLLVCFLLVFSVEAQKKEKPPNIKKAKSFWNKGKLEEAKTMIDRATEYPKTMNDGNTWYYRGLIYATIDTTSNETFNALSDNALETAVASFDKALDMAPEGTEYSIYDPINDVTTTYLEQINGYYTHYFGTAAGYYERDELEDASKYFELAGRILTTDTAAIVNAAYSARGYEDEDRATSLFIEAVERGAKDINNYYNIIFPLNASEDWQGVLDWVDKAQELYPADNSLGRFEVTSLLKLGKVDEAIAQLGESIKNSPNEADLRFSLALLYDQTDRKEEAFAYYQDALDIDPDHYETNFNMAVIKFGAANELYKELTQLTTSAEDRKTEQRLLPQINEGFSASLPYWEKCYSVKNDQVTVIQTLSFIYDFLKMKDKAAEMNKVLDDLE